MNMLNRFMSQVVPEPNSGCWLFDCADGPGGYSRFCFNKKVYRAHRVAFALFCSDPTGLNVCHKCDNPPCVNPDHLFLGTASDNLGDMSAKGRGRKAGTGPNGTRHFRAILTDDIVREIRTSTESQHAIARRLGLARSTVCHARSGRTWSHVK